MSDYKAEPVGKPPSKLKAHFRKYWWAHLLQFVLTSLLVTLLLLYVGTPAITQGQINKSVMSIESQVVTNPTANSVDIFVSNRLVTHSIFRPDLEAFNVSLFLEDTEPNIKPFGQLLNPKTHAIAEFVTNITQPMPILDMEQFIAYNKRVVESEEFRLGIRGRTRVHLGALPVSGADFNKAVTMKGLNKFKGTTVSDITISILPEPDGTNMRGTLHLPNPSVMTLEIGNMVQEVRHAGTGELIGNSTINNILLKPGMNSFPMKSISDQSVVLGILSKDTSKTGKIDVLASVLSVTNKRGQHLRYFEEAMKATPVALTLDLKAPLQKMGLNIFGDEPTAGASTGSATGGGITGGTESSAIPAAKSSAPSVGSSAAVAAVAPSATAKVGGGA